MNSFSNFILFGTQTPPWLPADRHESKNSKLIH